MRARILLIEDDASTGPALQKVLRAEDYEVDLVPRGDDGLARARAQGYDLVLTDFKLPGLSGLELVAQLHAAKPKLPIVLMTAHGTTATAIEATKFGACEYLTKPFEPDELLEIVASSVLSSRLMSEPVELGEARTSGFAIIGNSRAMQTVYKDIGRVAATPVTVLIRGATGTGKELIARAIYQHSDRAHKPFIAVNCAAIPQTLIESELFGHERGAFTGAQSRRLGRFEQANGGTLFLDEIGDLPIDTQAKLLRVLQERYIQRVGGNQNIPVDVRVLAATHRDLEAAIQEKDFREDLFFRISVVTIHLPPLNERTEDIPELVRYFIGRYATELGIDHPSIQAEAITLLQSQAWPGNVRELENVVRQSMLAARPFAISSDHVKQVLAKGRVSAPAGSPHHGAYIAELLSRAERGEVKDVYWQMIAELEPELFRQTIERAGGNQAKAARWLGITRLKMREKIAELGLRSDATPEPER
ncbi:MAG TPA: sigma-54 dependent transcriptional regulator [Candidatus Limnocylindria bacterium]|nr:sigma-54 dependent transcriptional regulator [Candidatus Limnocylindria bacterium]